MASDARAIWDNLSETRQKWLIVCFSDPRLSEAMMDLSDRAALKHLELIDYVSGGIVVTALGEMVIVAGKVTETE